MGASRRPLSAVGRNAVPVGPPEARYDRRQSGLGAVYRVAKEHPVRKPKRQRIDLDGPMTPAELHERVERLAVPTFDWVSEPILAIANGVTGASKHRTNHVQHFLTSLRAHRLGPAVGPEPGIAAPSR